MAIKTWKAPQLLQQHQASNNYSTPISSAKSTVANDRVICRSRDLDAGIGGR